jgi:hypothetical protein
MRNPSAKEPQATQEERPSAKRRLRSRVPVWVRVSVITAAVLVGVLVTTMLLGATGGGGDRDRPGGDGSGDRTEMNDGSGSDHTGGDHSGGDHGSDGEHTGGDHGPGGEHR